jgi:uncharacterized protein (DUF433 family)
MDYSKIITLEPGKRSGEPCVRGMRITVSDVLEYLAGGMTEEEILADFPYLTREDIRACLAYAAERCRQQLADVIEPQENDYLQRLTALAERRLIRQLSADELMELTRDKLPPLPTFDGGAPLVDVADRDALYEAMEGPDPFALYRGSD